MCALYTHSKILFVVVDNVLRLGIVEAELSVYGFESVPAAVKEGAQTLWVGRALFQFGKDESEMRGVVR